MELHYSIWYIGMAFITWAQSAHVARNLSPNYYKNFTDPVLHIVGWFTIFGWLVWRFYTGAVQESFAGLDGFVILFSVIVAVLLYVGVLFVLASIRIAIYYSWIGGYPDRLDHVKPNH